MELLYSDWSPDWDLTELTLLGGIALKKKAVGGLKVMESHKDAHPGVTRIWGNIAFTSIIPKTLLYASAYLGAW